MGAPKNQFQQMIPHPVTYSNERPLLDWASNTANASKYFLTKSLDWAYEEEERILNSRGPGIYNYSRKIFLHSVTAGVRVSNEDFQQLQEAVDKARFDTGKEIPLYRARLSSTTYKVFIQGHPDPRATSPDHPFVSSDGESFSKNK